jgi:DeoR family glycerol-3-phosphate regulon repressor
MRPRDRQSRITDMVLSQGKVSVDQLVETFRISAETIRRDLTFLAANGKIQKIHGGAIACHRVTACSSIPGRRH